MFKALKYSYPFLVGLVEFFVVLRYGAIIECSYIGFCVEWANLALEKF